MAPYDWRLSFKHLQVRDFYYSKLKSAIELAQLSNHNRKVVLVTHSMGALVIHYFMQWVQSPVGGQAGNRWVDQHIESIVNIGGPMLGVPKAWSALFSGEMKDTAELAPFLDYWRQRVVFSQADVTQMMRALFRYATQHAHIQQGIDHVVFTLAQFLLLFVEMCQCAVDVAEGG